MTDLKTQARYDEFCRAFLRPLLDGGAVEAGRPVTPGMLDTFASTRPGDLEVDTAIADRLHDFASDIAPVRILPWPDRGFAALSMAAHDLVLLTDPALDRSWGARDVRRKLVTWIDWFLDRAGAPRTRGEALVRHALASRVLELRRQDVTAHNWAFTHRYLGRPVPEGVFTRPRWVQVKKETTSVLALWGPIEEGLGRPAGLLPKFLGCSPITEILRTDLTPDFRFGVPSIAVLSDDLLRNGVARALVEEGAQVMAPLGEALRVLGVRGAAPVMLYFALALCYEMHVIATLDARAGLEPVFARPTSPSAALFCAVLPAMVGSPDDLVAFLDLDPDDLALVRRRARELDAVVGAESIAHAVALVDHAAPPGSAEAVEPIVPGGDAAPRLDL